MHSYVERQGKTIFFLLFTVSIIPEIKHVAIVRRTAGAGGISMCVESCAIFHAQVPRKLERDTLTRTHRTPQSRHDKINPWNSLIKHITYNSRTLKVTRVILFAKWWHVLGLVGCAPGSGVVPRQRLLPTMSLLSQIYEHIFYRIGGNFLTF